MFLFLYFFLFFSEHLIADTCYTKSTWLAQAELEDVEFLLKPITPRLGFENIHLPHPDSVMVKFKDQYQSLFKNYELLSQENIIAKCYGIIAAVPMTLARCIHDLGKSRLENTITQLENLGKSVPDNLSEYDEFKIFINDLKQRLKSSFESGKLNARADSELTSKKTLEGLEEYDESVHRTYYDAIAGTAQSTLGEFRVCSGLNPLLALCGKKSKELVEKLFHKFKKGWSDEMADQWESILKKIFLEDATIKEKEFDVIEIVDGRIIIHEVKTPQKATFNWNNKIKNLNKQFDIVESINSQFTPEIRAKFGCCEFEQQLVIVDNFTPEALESLRSPPTGQPIKYKKIKTNFN